MRLVLADYGCMVHGDRLLWNGVVVLGWYLGSCGWNQNGGGGGRWGFAWLGMNGGFDR